jgi:hypothetical protein
MIAWISERPAVKIRRRGRQTSPSQVENAADWQWLYHVNAKTIADPNVIYAGERLSIPLDPPAHYTPTGYQPRHAKPAVHVTSTATASGGTTADNAGSSSVGGYVPPSGDYSCTDLERLRDAAGGNPGAAFMAAEIATLNPHKNAQSAIILSGDGRNWDAWTTYTNGAYYSRC